MAEGVKWGWRRMPSPLPVVSSLSPCWDQSLQSQSPCESFPTCLQGTVQNSVWIDHANTSFIQCQLFFWASRHANYKCLSTWLTLRLKCIGMSLSEPNTATKTGVHNQWSTHHDFQHANRLIHPNIRMNLEMSFNKMMETGLRLKHLDGSMRGRLERQQRAQENPGWVVNRSIWRLKH